MSFGTPITPKVYDITVNHGEVEVVPFSGTAVFAQLSNLSSNNARVELNGDSEAVFTLAANTTQSFNYGDMHITAISIENTSSGNGIVDVEVILGLVV